MNRESLIVNAINAVNILQNKRLPIFESIGLTEHLNSNLMQLFESIVDFKQGSNYIGIEDFNGEILTSLNENNSFKLVSSFTRQNPDDIIEYKNNNLYAYLNKINECFDNQTDENIVQLFESIESINSVRETINMILVALEKHNDFEHITNNTALRVKMFNKTISVNGYNLYDIASINEFKNRKIHAIFYNINDNCLIIYCEGFVHTYYIKSDKLIDELFNYYEGMYYKLPYTNNRKKLYADLHEFIRSELQCLYMDYDYFKDENDTFNNLFNDERNTKILHAFYEQQKAKDEKTNKPQDDYKNGYLVGGNIY